MDRSNFDPNLNPTLIAINMDDTTKSVGIQADPDTGRLLVDAVATVTQLTHDNLNLNANLQIGNADVSKTNPVFVSAEKASSASTSTGVTVGLASTTIIASNASRKAVIIVNDSDETIYLKYGSGATSNSGIRLNASGGTVSEEMYTGIITGICASGSKIVTVTEI